MPAFDPRLVRITVEVSGGAKTYDQNLFIRAIGTKYSTAIQNECQVLLVNLDKDTQNFILTETSPYNFNRTPKLITVEAGRQSYGLSRIFSGTVFSSQPTQPPDIGVLMRCISNGFDNGNLLFQNQTAKSTLFEISKQVANSLNLTLDFQATDQTVSNFSYTGSSIKQIDALNNLGNFDVYQDDQLLIVKNKNIPLHGKTRILNLETGMIGIPELTAEGLKVKMLLDNQTVVGGALEVTSKVYPAANGIYTIYNLHFDIASRDTPFYYVAECARIRV